MPVAFQMATRRTMDAWLHSEWLRGIEVLRLMEKCASILGMPVAFQMATRRTVDAWLHSEWLGTSAIATVSTGATTTMTAARVASTTRSRCRWSSSSTAAAAAAAARRTVTTTLAERVKRLQVLRLSLLNVRDGHVGICHRTSSILRHPHHEHLPLVVMRSSRNSHGVVDDLEGYRAHECVLVDFVVVI